MHKDLETLFVVLDLKADEIENAKQLGDTKSVELQAASVLRCWRKLNGSAATKQVIIKALAKYKYEEAVGILCEKWGLASGGKNKTLTLQNLLLRLWKINAIWKERLFLLALALGKL